MFKFVKEDLLNFILSNNLDMNGRTINTSNSIISIMKGIKKDLSNLFSMSGDTYNVGESEKLPPTLQKSIENLEKQWDSSNIQEETPQAQVQTRGQVSEMTPDTKSRSRKIHNKEENSKDGAEIAD